MVYLYKQIKIYYDSEVYDKMNMNRARRNQKY